MANEAMRKVKADADARIAKDKAAAAAELAAHDKAAQDLIDEAAQEREKVVAEYKAREATRHAAEAAAEKIATPVVRCPACGNVFDPVEASR